MYYILYITRFEECIMHSPLWMLLHRCCQALSTFLSCIVVLARADEASKLIPGMSKLPHWRLQNRPSEAPKFSQDRPRASKSGPRAPQERPRASKSAPRAPVIVPRAPQERPKSAQERSKNVQERPKSRSRAPRDAQRALGAPF